MSKKQISQSDAVKLIKGLDNGAIYSVTFIKKDGTERMINSVKGTKLGVVGVGKKYNDEDKGLISVLDLQLVKTGIDHLKCWRTVRQGTIKEVKANNTVFEVV